MLNNALSKIMPKPRVWHHFLTDGFKFSVLPIFILRNEILIYAAVIMLCSIVLIKESLSCVMRCIVYMS